MSPASSHTTRTARGSTHSRALLLPGCVVARQYRVERLLCGRPLAEIYRASDLAMHRKVALKLYPAAEMGQIARDESRLQATTQHPNLMPLLAAGVDVVLGRAYLVLPYYPGEDLTALLDHRGPLSFQHVRDIGESVASGLEQIHLQRSMPHGDVKPANIWVTPGGGVMLCDFNTQALLARGADYAGTPGYTAPEALRGEIEPRSDIFSLGCVLYTCLAGVAPFSGDHEVLGGRFTPLHHHRPDIRPELEMVIHCAMAARPQNRFQSAREFRSALRNPRLAMERHWWLRIAAAWTRTGMALKPVLRMAWSLVRRYFSALRRHPAPVLAATAAAGAALWLVAPVAVSGLAERQDHILTFLAGVLAARLAPGWWRVFLKRSRESSLQ